MKKLYLNMGVSLAISAFAGGAFLYPSNQENTDSYEVISVEIANENFELITNEASVLPARIETEEGGFVDIVGSPSILSNNKGTFKIKAPEPEKEEPEKTEPKKDKEQSEKTVPAVKTEPEKPEPKTINAEPPKTETKTTNKETVKDRSVKVGNISVKVSASVSEKDYKMFIGWVENMPDILTKNINSISVIDDIESYNSFYNFEVSALTKNGKDIYVKSQNLAKRKGSLYHEAAHILDYVGGYSNTSFWADITSKEWASENHYSATNEAFAESISRYFVDGLNKEESKKAIKNLVDNGVFGVEDTQTNITLYAKNRVLWVYAGPDDFHNKQVGTVEIGSSIQAVSINADQTWYKVDYNGSDGFIRADMVSLEA